MAEDDVPPLMTALAFLEKEMREANVERLDDVPRRTHLFGNGYKEHVEVAADRDDGSRQVLPPHDIKRNPQFPPRRKTTIDEGKEMPPTSSNQPTGKRATYQNNDAGRSVDSNNTEETRQTTKSATVKQNKGRGIANKVGSRLRGITRRPPAQETPANGGGINWQTRRAREAELFVDNARRQQKKMREDEDHTEGRDESRRSVPKGTSIDSVRRPNLPATQAAQTEIAKQNKGKGKADVENSSPILGQPSTDAAKEQHLSERGESSRPSPDQGPGRLEYALSFVDEHMADIKTSRPPSPDFPSSGPRSSLGPSPQYSFHDGAHNQLELQSQIQSSAASLDGVTAVNLSANEVSFDGATQIINDAVANNQLEAVEDVQHSGTEEGQRAPTSRRSSEVRVNDNDNTGLHSPGQADIANEWRPKVVVRRLNGSYISKELYDEEARDFNSDLEMNTANLDILVLAPDGSSYLHPHTLNWIDQKYKTSYFKDTMAEVDLPVSLAARMPREAPAVMIQPRKDLFLPAKKNLTGGVHTGLPPNRIYVQEVGFNGELTGNFSSWDVRQLEGGDRGLTSEQMQRLGLSDGVSRPTGHSEGRQSAPPLEHHDSAMNAASSAGVSGRSPRQVLDQRHRGDTSRAD